MCMDEGDVFRIEGWCGKREEWTETMKELEGSCGKGVELCLGSVKTDLW